jgi:hypothetical protein
MMKTKQDYPSYFADRQSERTPVSSVARLASSWYSVEVKICDVSQSGFKAECPEPVQIGSLVSLHVPGVGAVDAQVRWQIGLRMGGMFLDPISLNRCEWIATRTNPPGSGE